jgi:MFS family permease
VFNDLKLFLNQQKTNFKIIILRDFLLLTAGTRPRASTQIQGYESLFLKRLGASPLDIGLINSMISLVTMFFSVPAGWLIDRMTNMKRMYLTSSGFGLFHYLALAIAQSVPGVLIVTAWKTITDRLTLPAKTILDIDALPNRDRVTGLSVHRTITALGGVIGPIIVAYVLTASGGLDNVDSYRHLFLFQWIMNGGILLILWTKLNDVLFDRAEKLQGLRHSFASLFRGSTALKLFFVKDIVQNFFALMVTPFIGIYQVDVKLATAVILGAMGAGEMIVDVFLSIPIGGVIARFGRRRMAYLGHLVGFIARCVLFLTPRTHPEFLILYSLLGSVEGCLYLGWDAFAQEIIPQNMRGRYLGIRAVTVGVIGMFAPIIGGLIWNLNSDFLWWINALQWLLIAFPFLVILMEKFG